MRCWFLRECGADDSRYTHDTTALPWVLFAIIHSHMVDILSKLWKGCMNLVDSVQIEDKQDSGRRQRMPAFDEINA